MPLRAEFPWDPPAEHGRHSIRIELDHPVNPWEHEGAGSITWGASLDRLAPLGEEAVSIIKEAWTHRDEEQHEQRERETEESQPIDRAPANSAGVKPGWAERIDRDQYWIRLTLYQPVNEQWLEKSGRHWSSRQLINDGVVERTVIVEATTDLGRRALRIVEALHSAHPLDESDPPEREDWYR